MKIAIIADTHFGYPRFEEDSFLQAERAFLHANDAADVILCAGDIFDAKIPRLESIAHAASIFQKLRIPIYAIHGNHERRGKGMTNPVELLSRLGLLQYIHNRKVEFEKNDEKISITGLGSVPEDFAKIALQKVLKSFPPIDSNFRILMLHQSIRELVAGDEEELSLSDLEPLPFDLIINGHIHSRTTELKGKLLIPGSTVITQLKKEEMLPRTYILYDTTKRSYEFVEVECRPFFLKELEFKDASLSKINEEIKKLLDNLPQTKTTPIVRIKLKGTLMEGMKPGDLTFAYQNNIYIDNELNAQSLKEKISRIRELRDQKLSVREIALKLLKEKLAGRITLFDPDEFFEKLEDPEDALEYLNSCLVRKQQ